MKASAAEILHYEFITRIQTFSFVENIYLFGSRARGDHQKLSDIDLAIDCPDATGSDWIQILNVIDEADTLLKIDCIRLDEVDEAFKKHILREGIKIYERNKNKK
jgi:predicted nucleotidyltransferase